MINHVMNADYRVRPRTIAAVVVGIGLLSCARSSPAIPEERYSKELVGRWQGGAGGENEVMAIDMNGHFVCRLHQRGFLANTLSQGVTGTVSGTWSVSGKTLMLVVDDTRHEHLKNGATSSEIVAFNDRALVLRSHRGNISTFYRSR